MTETVCQWIEEPASGSSDDEIDVAFCDFAFELGGREFTGSKICEASNDFW